VTRKSQEQFKYESELKWGAGTVEVVGEYVGAHVPILFRCLRHDVTYEQSPHSHLKGTVGCKVCYPDKSLTKEDWLARFLVNKDIEGNHYKYPDLAFKRAHEKIFIVCALHGSFRQRVYSHANEGQGCPKCALLRNADKKRLTAEEVVVKFRDAHPSGGFDYSRVANTYRSMNQQLEIGCTTCGSWFKQIAANHAAGAGCPRCKWNFKLRAEKRDREVVDAKVVGKIYMITCRVNGKVYIGQTFRRRPQDRVNSHFLDSETNPHLRSSVEKHGREAFYWEWIDEVTSVVGLNEKERYWIQKLNPSLDPQVGYNLNYGGEGSFISDSTRRKLSERSTGRKQSVEFRQRLSDRMSGANNPMHGKHPKRTGIRVERSDGVVFDSLTAAANSVGLNKTTISRASTLGRASGGFTWRVLVGKVDPGEGET